LFECSNLTFSLGSHALVYLAEARYKLTAGFVWPVTWL